MEPNARLQVRKRKELPTQLHGFKGHDLFRACSKQKLEEQGSLKSFKEIQKLGPDRQDGKVRDVLVDRLPGAPASGERVFVQNFGECTVHSCQPAGRHALRLTVRRA